MSTIRFLGLGTPSYRTAARLPTHVTATSNLRAGKRSVQTQSLPASVSPEILNKQRLLRPTSPHLAIYQPQVTSVLSIGNRAAGATLSSSIREKTVLAAPFAFHSLNGVRHLSWDMGKFMTIKAVYQTGYAVLVGTAVSTVALVFLQ
ncbi:succinate dehydrogenase cytochrome b560 subunit [Mycena crocata]|nr:succinate dehydrogenase cytochrome b560 subunit [Mycena crocata]